MLKRIALAVGGIAITGALGVQTSAIGSLNHRLGVSHGVVRRAQASADAARADAASARATEIQERSAVTTCQTGLRLAQQAITLALDATQAALAQSYDDTVSKANELGSLALAYGPAKRACDAA